MDVLVGASVCVPVWMVNISTALFGSDTGLFSLSLLYFEIL